LWLALAASCALALVAAACGSSNNNGSGGGGGAINGAGSTFAAPLYEQWNSALKDQGVTVNYQAIGSGGGQEQLIAGTVDFAGSDPPLEDSQIKQAEQKQGSTPVHVPVAFGAVTVSYNLPGIKSGLKLDGATVADIFLGKIKKWNDPAIAKQNPGLKLPDTDISVVHRSDDSGTTKLFTTFLSDYSSEWKSKVGVDSTVKWPTGTGANGNDGVAGGVKQTEGAVGYVELAYALQNNFTTADVKNSAGKYVTPDLKSTQAAAASAKVPADLRFVAVNAPGSGSYPIASGTDVLVYKDMCKAGISEGTAKNVVKFLDYGLSSAGQKVAESIQYAADPPSLLAAAKKQVAGLECNGKPITG
jgi:phosphate transport system substrate-binding protein